MIGHARSWGDHLSLHDRLAALANAVAAVAVFLVGVGDFAAGNVRWGILFMLLTVMDTGIAWGIWTERI